MVAISAFLNLSPIFLKLACDGGSERDEDPAVRPVRREAGRRPGRGRAAWRERTAALRVPRAQPVPPDGPGGAVERRLRGGSVSRPPASAQRAALEAAPRRRAGASDRPRSDRAPALGGRVRR